MPGAPRRPSRQLRLIVVIVALGALGAAPKRPAPDLPALNEKVVAFARANLGKKVGDGICITLAVEALKQAGARPFPLDRADGDYVWGRPIDGFKDALPGDILQFRDAEFKGKKQLTKRRWISWHYTYPHHTAIVSSVSEEGKVVSMLHQNVGPKDADPKVRQVVQEVTLRVDSLQEGGWVRIYRPMPRDGFGEPPDSP